MVLFAPQLGSVKLAVASEDAIFTDGPHLGALLTLAEGGCQRDRSLIGAIAALLFIKCANTGWLKCPPSGMVSISSGAIYTGDARRFAVRHRIPDCTAGAVASSA